MILQLTKTTEQNSPSEADSCADSREISCIYGTQGVLYHIRLRFYKLFIIYNTNNLYVQIKRISWPT
jgi:hypothetical protein